MNPPAKRPKILRQSQLASYDATAATADGAEAEEPDILWEQRSFFALDPYQELDALQYLPAVWDTTSAGTAGSSKRGEHTTIRSSIKQYSAEV